jgi:metallo-beta-lactamase class B
MNSKVIRTVLTFALMVAISPALYAQLTLDRLDSSNRADNEDQTRRNPINIIDNIWWVGHSEVGSFLITTPEGHILMDSTSPEQVSWTVESIIKAGFHLDDIKYILNSHPHEEHIGGLAALQRLIPHAKIITSRATADIIATGGKSDFRNMLAEQAGDSGTYFEPVKVDGFIGDNEAIELGGTKLIAHLTPGHTTGTTTWSMTVKDKDGKSYNAVFMGGMSASGIDRGPLLNNELYPNIAKDFESSFAKLKAMQCDVYLYARASSIELDDKLAKVGEASKNPFIDPEGCAWYIEYYEKRYQKQLEDEMAAR